MPDFREGVMSHCRLLTAILDIHIYHRVLVNISGNCCLCCAYNRLDKRVMLFLEDKGETDSKTLNTDIVLKHGTFDKVFAIAGIADMPEGVDYLLGIHGLIMIVYIYSLSGVPDLWFLP